MATATTRTQFFALCRECDLEGKCREGKAWEKGYLAILYKFYCIAITHVIFLYYGTQKAEVFTQGVLTTASYRKMVLVEYFIFPSLRNNKFYGKAITVGVDLLCLIFFFILALRGTNIRIAEQG